MQLDGPGTASVLAEQPALDPASLVSVGDEVLSAKLMYLTKRKIIYSLDLDLDLNPNYFIVTL